MIHIVVHDTDGEAVPAPQGCTFNDPDTFAMPNPARNTARNDPPTFFQNNRRNTKSHEDDEAVEEVVESLNRAIPVAKNVLDQFTTSLSAR